MSPLFVSARLRTLRRRLTAGAWAETDDPYLLLEVPEEELAAFAPGFEVALDAIVDVIPNPYATIERYDDIIVLVLHGEGMWTPVPFAHWPADGDSDLIVMARGLLPPEEEKHERALADVITSGQAYFSTVAIIARLPPPDLTAAPASYSSSR